MQIAGRVAQRYLSTLPHGVSWFRIPLLACQSALRRCCPLLASLPARPPAFRRCCPSPHHPPCMSAGDPASLLLLLSFQAEHPPPGGRGGLDVANQGNWDPNSTRQVPPPPPPLPPPQAQHLHERPYPLKPLAPTISRLVQRTGRPHGRPGRPISPLPCTNPIPLALHADRWPCGPAVTQYTAAWRVLSASPPPGMSVGAPTVLSAPSFFLSRRDILPRAVGEDLTSPTGGTGAPKVPGSPSPSPLLYPPPPSACAPSTYPPACTGTRTTALGGVCPAPRPHGMGVSEARLSRTSPMRGTPWAPKALFGSGRQAQSPKPPCISYATIPN